MSAYQGKYAGYVRDTGDPENRGRLRCYCPEVMGQADDADHWLPWALPCFPWIVSRGVGDTFVPAVNSAYGVWIEFRHGNVAHPIWCGVFLLDAADIAYAKVEIHADSVILNAGDAIQLTSGNTVAVNATTAVTVDATVEVEITSAEVKVSGTLVYLSVGPHVPTDAVVVGRGIDPFTGAPYLALGSCALFTFAK